MRVAVCRPHVPFAHGGVEIFTDTLVEELRARSHEAELVSVPHTSHSDARALTQALLWRMLDLGEADGSPVDVVVATEFPSYLVRHPEKRVWLVDPTADRAVRGEVDELDRVALGEASRLFAVSANIAARLEASTGLQAGVLPQPPDELDWDSCIERLLS